MTQFGEYAVPDEVYYRTIIQGERVPKGGGNGQVQPFIIKAWTPENWTVSTHGNFEAKLGGGIASLVQSLNPVARVPGLGGLVDKTAGLLSNGGMAAFTGVSDVTQEMTLQTWVSSEPLSFSLPLLFNSEMDAYADVYAQVMDLAKLPLPWKKNFFGVNMLAGPGMSYFDWLKKENVENVSLSIGKRVFIPIVLVDSANIEFDTMVDPNGNYISARVDLSVRTPFVPTRDDIDTWFGIDPAGTPTRQTWQQMRDNTNIGLWRELQSQYGSMTSVSEAVKGFTNRITSGGGR